MVIKDIREHEIVFETRLKRGVAFVPGSMVELAERLARKTGREIVDIEGDFEETRFIIDPPYDFEELEDLLAL
jgi:hypothetical protein